MTDKTPPEVVASGVEALLKRLREDGVASGQAAADEIVAKAQAAARETVRSAKAEAEQILSQARSAAHEFERAGMAALTAASRDAILELKNNLVRRFTEEVQRLVHAEIQTADTLQKMILEVVGSTRETVDNAAEARVLLPETAVDLEQLRRNPDEYAEGPLIQFVREATHGLLRQGVELSTDPNLAAGLRVQMDAEGVQLDLRDTAIAGLLARHLQPRFRAILDGVVR